MRYAQLASVLGAVTAAAVAGVALAHVLRGDAFARALARVLAPTLAPEQRNNWRFIGPGTGIHWPDLDEDISVAGLLGLPD